MQGPPVGALSCPFFGWEGSPTKIDYREKDTLILASLLGDLAERDIGICSMHIYIYIYLHIINMYVNILMFVLLLFCSFIRIPALKDPQRHFFRFSLVPREADVAGAVCPAAGQRAVAGEVSRPGWLGAQRWGESGGRRISVPLFFFGAAPPIFVGFEKGNPQDQHDY